jgi:regulator of RNase E activity RraB
MAPLRDWDSMTNTYPDDSDGGALRSVASNGSDMSKPMYIDFQVAMPDEKSARQLAVAAGKLGYRTRVYSSIECRLPWTCECSTRMLATYEGVISVQDELAMISAELGGVPDGWGTFGNSPNGQPDVQ